MNTNKIIRQIIPQQVKVRKYEVDLDNLKIVLRNSKQKSKLSNKEIAKKLNQSITLVEHWFRNDNCFAIPSEDIWLDLKKLLDITTDEFDKSIMTFEIRDGIYDKSNRVYDCNGIAPTLTATSAETERYLIFKEMNMNYIEKKYTEFINENGYIPDMFNPYHCQEIKNTAPTQTTYCGSVTSSATVLINQNNINRSIYMYQNIMKKLNFKMEEIKLFDSFAGIGALHQSLKELGIPTKLIGVSEIDPDAIISYAGGHIERFKDLEFDYPSEKYMRDWLMKRNIGWDFKKNKSSIPRLKKDKLYKCYKACILINNLGDVSLLNYENIPDFDLFNFSFPCTDYSAAGKQKGKEDEEGNLTRSGLYTYGIEVIKHKKPKYIMIENVKGLIQKKFSNDFYSIVNEIEELGYNCYYPKKDNGSPCCLNAKDYGIPQNRERIFVICIRKDINTSDFEFPVGFDNGIRLKDILEDKVDEKYYLSEEIQERFKITPIFVESLDTEKCILDASQVKREDRPRVYVDYSCTLNSRDYKDPRMVLDKEPKIVAMRGRYTDEGDIEQQFETRKDNNTNIITTVQKDNLLIEPNYRIRKLTPLECWLLMGFKKDFFERAKELGISDSSLYKQAGNSIVVNVLYFIFKNLFKQYIVNK